MDDERPGPSGLENGLNGIVASGVIRDFAEYIWRPRMVDEEVIKNSGEFGDEFVMELVQTRLEFAEKIARNPNHIEQILEFINKEKYFYAKLANLPNTTQKQSVIEKAFLKRIVMLLEYVIEKSTPEEKLIVEYHKYSRLGGFTVLLKQSLENLLKKCSANPLVWVHVGRYYAFGYMGLVNNVVDALLTYVAGLMKHPTCKELYIDYIVFDLICLGRFSDSERELNQRAHHITRLETTVNKSFIFINDLHFFIEVLERLQVNKHTIMVQSKVVDFLKGRGLHVPRTWHILAQRQAVDLYASYDNLQMQDRIDYHNSLISGLTKLQERTSIQRLECTLAKYGEGLHRVPAEIKYQMWQFYINYLFKIHYECNGVATAFKLNVLKAALGQASIEKCLDETHYVQWLVLPDIGQEGSMRILEKALEMYPRSVSLWTDLVGMYLVHKDSNVIDITLKRATEILGDKAVRLWEIVTDYYLSADLIKVIELYEDGLIRGSAISNFVKPKYLELIISKNGNEAGKVLYMRLVTLKPYCKGLHHTMMMYMTISKDDLEFYETVYQLYCDQFGKDDTNSWVTYIQFYFINRERMPNFQEKIKTILEQAKAKLDPYFHDKFEEDYLGVFAPKVKLEWL